MNSNRILAERRSPSANQLPQNKGNLGKHNPDLKLNLKMIGKESNNRLEVTYLDGENIMSSGGHKQRKVGMSQVQRKMVI